MPRCARRTGGGGFTRQALPLRGMGFFYSPFRSCAHGLWEIKKAQVVDLGLPSRHFGEKVEDLISYHEPF